MTIHPIHFISIESIISAVIGVHSFNLAGHPLSLYSLAIPFMLILISVQKLSKAKQRVNQKDIVKQEQIELDIEKLNQELAAQNRKIYRLKNELHHRVKNNLQLVSSMLNLQSRSQQSEDAKAALKEGKLRMQALSILHQKLYIDEQPEVCFDEYVAELAAHLNVAFTTEDKAISIQLELEKITLSLDRAVPVAIILNELMINSLKHSHKKLVEISVSAKEERQQVLIKLEDNGDGISEETFFSGTSYGVTIIKALIEQIEGKLSLERKKGTIFQLMFSKNKSSNE